VETALLDTHILLWWLEGGARLSRRQKRIITTATAERPLRVSDITLWEIATLYSLGRLKLRMSLREWLEAAVAPPLVQSVAISPAVAAEVAAIPPTFHRDPADRILVATARVIGAALITQDKRIIDAGIIETIA
jgi:PIN domain nuclease of toxin-antitoxin system